ncbi:MAG TPA: hypothetical protein VK742_00435 [Candidatus Sulfotelmatobacter sp.]|jgi:hypothetical protein|nr:hypothetical protein [Candidatus Sulfotelmatobacter sp.]
MSDTSFIGYVGDRDFHDGSILAVERADDSVRVRVRGASGKIFVVEFAKVGAVTSSRPEGMLLYALSEMQGQPPFRRFVFANSDEEDDAVLEIDAERLSVYEAVA